jgi:digeranylgeranylglycerophospholipid reductase
LRIHFQAVDPDLTEMLAPRRVLDALLKDHAVESGAEFIQARATALIKENGRVAGVRVAAGGAAGEFRCRLLIGADGSGSTIARLLGGEARDPEDAVAIRGYFPNVDMDPGTAEIHLLRELWPEYAWIFPAGGNTANVGLGLTIGRYRKMKKNLKSILSDFIHSPGNRERFGGSFEMPDLQVCMLKFYSPKRTRRAFDGALLIGDAAALVNPLNGGGIVNAMTSGILAAGIADRALAENDVSRKRLREYETALWKALGRELALSWRVKKMSSSPAVMETVMKFVLANKKMVALAGRYYRDVKFHAE